MRRPGTAWLPRRRRACSASAFVRYMQLVYPAVFCLARLVPPDADDEASSAAAAGAAHGPYVTSLAAVSLRFTSLAKSTVVSCQAVRRVAPGAWAGPTKAVVRLYVYTLSLHRAARRLHLQQ